MKKIELHKTKKYNILLRLFKEVKMIHTDRSASVNIDHFRRSVAERGVPFNFVLDIASTVRFE